MANQDLARRAHKDDQSFDDRSFNGTMQASLESVVSRHQIEKRPIRKPSTRDGQPEYSAHTNTIRGANEKLVGAEGSATRVKEHPTCRTSSIASEPEEPSDAELAVTDDAPHPTPITESELSEANADGIVGADESAPTFVLQRQDWNLVNAPLGTRGHGKPNFIAAQRDGALHIRPDSPDSPLPAFTRAVESGAAAELQDTATSLAFAGILRVRATGNPAASGELPANESKAEEPLRIAGFSAPTRARPATENDAGAPWQSREGASQGKPHESSKLARLPDAKTSGAEVRAEQLAVEPVALERSEGSPSQALSLASAFRGSGQGLAHTISAAADPQSENTSPTLANKIQEHLELAGAQDTWRSSSMEPVKEMVLRVAAAESPVVDLAILRRQGEVQVSVRTPDASLQASLRAHLPELVDSLDRRGLDAVFTTHSGTLASRETATGLRTLSGGETDTDQRETKQQTIHSGQNQHQPRQGRAQEQLAERWHAEINR